MLTVSNGFCTIFELNITAVGVYIGNIEFRKVVQQQV